MDQDDIIQYKNFKDFNIHHSYRIANTEANYLRNTGRHGKYSATAWGLVTNHSIYLFLENQKKRQRSRSSSQAHGRS